MSQEVLARTGSYESVVCVDRESPAQFMERLVVERPEYADPCGQIADMIDRGVPGANLYPAAFQQLYGVADTLPTAFPARLRAGVARATREQLGDALFASAYHLDHGNVTEASIRLYKGAMLPVHLYGTQPLEGMYDVAANASRIFEVMADPEVRTVPVVANAAYCIYRLIDPDNPGAPTVQMYIRPRGGLHRDKHYEYGNSRGVSPSVNVSVDNRMLNYLAREAFLGEVVRRGAHADTVVSLRTDLDDYHIDDWYTRAAPMGPLTQQGTVTFDNGSLFGRDRPELRIGRFFALGNTLRSEAEGVPARLNHVPSFREVDGNADNFALAAEELIAELERKRITYGQLRRHVSRKSSRIRLAAPEELPIIVTERNLQDINSCGRAVSPDTIVRTADEVLEWSEELRSNLQAEIQEDTILHQLIAKRSGRFNFSTHSDGPLPIRAADILAPYDRTAARWELLQREARMLTPEEQDYFETSLALRLGMITTLATHKALSAIPNENKVVIPESGANETSVIRGENACELVGNDPGAVIWHPGSGRVIPRFLHNGELNSEYQIVTSDRVAGGVLPPAVSYSEYQVNVASAIKRGWKADIRASEYLNNMLRGVEEAAVLRSSTRPDIHSFKPNPAKHGRATIGMGVRALAGSGVLNETEYLLLATTSQYAPKTTIQSARALRAMGMGDVRVQAVGRPGSSSAQAYQFETAVLLRLLEKV